MTGRCARGRAVEAGPAAVLVLCGMQRTVVALLMRRISIVVVGASAGGMDALTRLIAQLPADFPAAVFVVHHMAADSSGSAVLKAINRAGSLACAEARDGEVFETGRVYTAPPDHHLLVGKGEMKVTKGARENRSRPSIDPLFRSAAVAYRSRVIGVILTGYLDDGSAGLSAIQRCGGVCIVQDPDDAAYPDMPRNALDRVPAAHRVPLAEMGAMLEKLVHRRATKDKPVPKDIAIEAKIAERVLSDLVSVNALGDQVPFNCPNCGGVLWEVAQGEGLRYRCHTGHAFTSPVLLAEQSGKIEETLWIALRMFEERRNLLVKMSERHGGAQAKASAERAKESDVHIDRIRAMLLAGDAAPFDEADARRRKARVHLHAARRARRG
jgi:two-component system, chemotaxis family, protein-glutamate methylesterase/glutaminase